MLAFILTDTVSLTPTRAAGWWSSNSLRFAHSN